jgi:hypothetical protein
MNIFNKSMLLGLSVISLIGCSKSSDSAPAGPSPLETGLAGVISTATSKLTEAVPGGDALSSSLSSSAIIQTEYGSTDIQIFSAQHFTTPQTYVQFILNKAEDVDPNDGMGLINRFKQKIVSGMCPIVGLHPDANSDGLPDIGSGTFVLPNFSDSAVAASIVAKCPGANVASLANASGATIGYTVTDVSGEAGSQYTIKSVIDFGNDGSPDNVLYYKADGSIIRFAFVEVDSSTISGGSLFEYDGTTLKFDFHGGNQDGHYRMLYNGSTRDIALYAFNMQDSNNLVYMSMVGNRTVSTAALTLTAKKSGTNVVENGQACVTATGSTFPWSANFSSGTCGSITGSDFTSAPAVVAFSQAFQGSKALSTFTPADKVLFTNAAEMLTSAILD